MEKTVTEIGGVRSDALLMFSDGVRTVHEQNGRGP